MSNLESVLREINKKYGAGTIRTANEFPVFTRISTGIFSLDAEMGGGIPKGRIVIFAGNESTGKTTVATKCIAQFQNTCRNCLAELDVCICGDREMHKAVFIDMEGAFDPNWFTTLGGNVEELLLLQPEFAEQAVDIVEALVRTGEVDIIVIDSIAMMSPSVEIEKSSEDLLVGTHARLMNRMMRSIQAGMNSLGMTNEKKPSVILINQIRSKVGVMYGDTTTYPGGLGQKFASSITAKFTARPSEYVYEESNSKKKEEAPIGIQVRFKIEKNKTFLPLRSGMFTLYVSDSVHAPKGSINTEEQIADYGIRYGIIDKSGAWLTFNGAQYQGKNSLVDAIIADKGLKDTLKKLIIAKISEETSSTEEAGDGDSYE